MNTVIVLDTSGSMVDLDLPKVLADILENLQDSDVFQILQSGGEGSKLTLTEGWTPVTPAAILRYCRIVANIQPGGPSDLRQALNHAFGVVRWSKRATAVLVVTDGHFPDL